MSTLFLVQIPDTAGSRLRLAACRAWGSGRIVSDYGPTSRHTSEAVLEYIHLENDFHLFKHFLDKNDIAMFTSRSPLGRLRRIFNVKDIVTFVRDPIELVYTRYQAATRDGYRGDLETFARARLNRNIQSRFLRGVPLELLGFVGISEKFSASLALLNKQYDCELSELNSASDTHPENEMTSDIDKSGAKLTRAKRQLITELNTADVDMYQSALRLFDTRQEMQIADTPYVHGRVQKLSASQIEGWAVAYDQTEPCKIRLHVNNDCVAIVPAIEYSPKLKERNVSRDGYVGFSHQFKRDLTPKDTVTCYIHRTEQLLTGPRRPVPNDRNH